MIRDSHPLLSASIAIDYPARPAIVRDARFEIETGEIVGLVGASGSGKTSIGLAVLKLLELKGGKARGELLFRGRNLLGCTEKEMRNIRGREIGLVLQSPVAALNPALRIGTQLAEACKAHAGPRGKGMIAHLLDLLASVSLPAEEPFLRRYPGELSVGQAQRVVIAMGVMHRPALLVADEPTSALDVVSHAEILKLFQRLNQGLDMGILYISHDLLSVASFCHRVAILHEGAIVEFGETERIFENPAHPYTRQLIEAIPRPPMALWKEASALAAGAAPVARLRRLSEAGICVIDVQTARRAVTNSIREGHSGQTECGIDNETI